MKPGMHGCLLLLLLPTLAQAKIEAPDHVIYGNATLFGASVPAGVVIELRSEPGQTLLARYTLGREVQLGNQFKLRIPMDTVEPRPAGRARPGDSVRIYIASQLAAETTVGEVGVAVRLDLDPQNMGTGPAVAISNASALEGNAGTSPLTFLLDLNTTAAGPVTVAWQTQAGTAVGGVTCAAGIDYIDASGVAEIAAGSLQGAFAVAMCGDVDLEIDETLSVLLSNVDGGVLVSNSATGTLIDDDDVPMLIVPDARALEPAAGAADLVFRPRLSRPSAVATSFSFSTSDLSASAGSDYAAQSGTVQFAAGELQSEIRIPIMADAPVEAREQFRLMLTAPVAINFQRNEAFGDIVDPQFDPAVHLVEEETGPAGVLTGPSDVVISPEGTQAYVASAVLDSVLAYARDPADGRLSFLNSYSVTSPGFTDALLDGPSDLTLSTDGRHLYVAARNSNAVVVLERDVITGALTFVQNQTGPALLGANALQISTDDGHLYASGGAANSISVYQRDSATGALTLLEVESNNVDDPGDIGPVVVALDIPSGIAISADGGQVYIASRFGNSVAIFDRNPDTGAAEYGRLSFRSSLRNGLQGVSGIAGAFDLVVSPDDAQIYVVGESSNSLVRFDRAADGSLSWRERWSQGDSGVHGLGGPQSVSIAPDGSQVYVAGFADDSFTIFRRATASGIGIESGQLAVQQTVFAGEGQVALLTGPVAIAVSPDDLDIYVAASTDNAVVVFRREINLVPLLRDGFESNP